MANEKSYDPQMHTAEHILNQTMVRSFGCGRSFSNHIERKKSKCDYHIDRPLADDEVDFVSAEVNRIINEDLEVSDSYLTREEAAQILDLSRLPEDAGDEIRVVRVGNYDACACIGPHVSRTSEIGTFIIISTDYADGVLRIRFK